MTEFKEFAISKFVLRFYKTDHVWTCTMTENMLDEVSKELALQRLSDIGQAIEQEPVAWMLTLPDGTHDWILDGNGCEGYIPLYTHPVKELTDEEIRTIQDMCHLKNVGYNTFIMRFARAILQKAREK